MKGYDSVYLPKLVEEQGILFEKVSNEGYDIEKFVFDFMNSRLQRGIAVGAARVLTQTAEEMLDSLRKEGIVPIKSDKKSDSLRNKWVGRVYCYIQWLTRYFPNYLIDRVPFDDLCGRYDDLHDRPIEESSCVLIKQFGIASDDLIKTKEYHKYALSM